MVDKRIAPFFRIYTQILNYSTYMLVSHRNMISVYDMSAKEEQDWIDTVSFDGGYIRQMHIKKRDKEERRDMVRKKIEKGEIEASA